MAAAGSARSPVSGLVEATGNISRYADASATDGARAKRCCVTRLTALVDSGLLACSRASRPSDIARAASSRPDSARRLAR